MPDRYGAALHRMQTAVALDFSHIYADLGPEVVGALKHLRVGINSAMASQEGLARLLIEKGLFTQEEYNEAMVVAAEREADARVEEVRKKYTLPDNVKFGADPSAPSPEG